MKSIITAAFLLGAAGLVSAAVPAAIPKPSTELLAEDAADYNGTMSLTPRKVEYGHSRGRVICGKYPNANYVMFGKLVYNFDNDDRKKEFTIAGGQCDRVSCYDTTALYVCNVSFAHHYSCQITLQEGQKEQMTDILRWAG